MLIEMKINKTSSPSVQMYKEIARIIKEHFTKYEAEYFTDDLADYFDKEVEEHRKKLFITCPENCWCWDWNREEFLKDCGVT